MVLRKNFLTNEISLRGFQTLVGIEFKKGVKMKKLQITKHIEIEDLVRNYPASIKFLAEKGIKCIACGEPIWGTLEEAAKEKGFDDPALDQIVIELIAIV